MKWHDNVTAIVVLVGVVVLMGGCVATATGGCGRGYSEGSRSCVVTKLSRKGVMFKSYEGEGLMGGMTPSDGGTAVPATFKFSVESESVAKEIEAAMASGQRVSLKYDQYLIKPMSVDTDYIVVAVKKE